MPPELIGQNIGRFRVDALIGEGGMGRVYRGFDASLARNVAIKILPEKVAEDKDRLDRFVREARSASALNHPNVVTIYEIGAHGSQQYIAMELLDGETLRERLMRGKFDLRRAVDTVAQIADGMAAAHAAGIIHRDLKPENIVMTKAGFVKILDFGLAKLRDAGMPGDDGNTAKKTDPGTVLGSVGYMSPEQAAGREVDHRSDIFSVGCILFEVVAGRRAFSGESSIDTLHKILHDDPPSLRDLTADVPNELQRIVRKCLAKDPDERYQSAKDLAIDLRALRRDVDSQPKATTLESVPLRKAPKWLGAVIALAVIAVALVIALRPRKAVTRSAPMTVSRITASGHVNRATVSPNGEYVAFAYSDSGKHSLFLRQLATGSSLELVPPATVGMWGVSFAPDSRSVYYAMKTFTDPGGALYQISILGGTPRRLLTRIDSSVTFSPDGKQIAFTRLNEPSSGHSAIIVANVDGTGEKVLASKAAPQAFAPIFWGAPSWSPDGEFIATALNVGREFAPVAISVADGSEKQLSHDTWVFVGHLTWLHDMKGLLMIGRAATGTAIDRTDPQVWTLSYPEGERRQVTNDLFEYRMVSLTADDQQLVTVAADQTGATWLAPLTTGEKPVKLTNGKYDGLAGIAAAPDAVVFATRDSGRSMLYSVNRDGTDRKILSGDFDAMSPALSLDGRYLVFATPRANDWALMRANRDGSNPKLLCSLVPAGHPPGVPTISSDSKFVLFEAAPDGNTGIFRVSIDGGTPAAVPVQGGGFSLALSPDQKWVAYISVHRLGLVVAPAAGGAPAHIFPKVSPNNYSMLRWTADGKAILHNAAANDRKNVWMQPIDGSEARQVTSFDDQYVLGFDVVPGGKELVVVRGTLSRDAMLIKNFR